jgi:endoglucanase
MVPLHLWILWTRLLGNLCSMMVNVPSCFFILETVIFSIEAGGYMVRVPLSKSLVLWTIMMPPQAAAAPEGPKPRVFFNQLGYRTLDRKVITVADTSSLSCDVMDQQGRMTLTTPLQDLSVHPDYPMNLKSCDVSALQQPGSYTLKIGDFRHPLPLRIAHGPWKDLMPASNKVFYFQRASVPLEAVHAGPWARPAGHPDNSLRTVVDGEPETKKNVPGGWYDAGDYGKYVVNAGISVATLLLQAERYPESVGDQLNIPESNNAISDLLDELRYELNWLIRMQDSDGGVHFKVGGAQWSGFVLPHQDFMERLIIGKSTASTLPWLPSGLKPAVFMRVLIHLFRKNC